MTKAKEKLKSPEGVLLYRRRGFEVETVFGEMKRNQKFRRFSLRGLEKIRTEIGLLCLAHNFKKLGLYLMRLMAYFVAKYPGILHYFLLIFNKCTNSGLLYKKNQYTQLYGLFT